jgi:hypothetical protein
MTKVREDNSLKAVKQFIFLYRWKMARTTRFEVLVVDERLIDRITVLNMLETFINELSIVMSFRMGGEVEIESVASLSPEALYVVQQVTEVIYLWLAHKCDPCLVNQ